MIVRIKHTIDGRWLRTDPIRLGAVPSGSGTPALYVLVGSDDAPVGRIDVYTGEESTLYEFAQLWQDKVVIAYGHRLMLVDIESRSAKTVDLGSYFSDIKILSDFLIVASAERLFRVDTYGDLAWKSEVLGVDGVVIDAVNDSIVSCRAEVDPPGGWIPFELNIDTGHVV